MKRLLLFFCIALSSLLVEAQETGKLNFVEVVPVEGVSADYLYDQVEIWVSQAFKNPDRVLRYKNKETHQLILSPEAPFQYSRLVGSEGVKGSIAYTLKVNTREGRYRIEITNCYHNATYSFGLLTSDSILLTPKHKGASLKWQQNVWTELLETMKQEFLTISGSLKASIIIPDSSESEEW